MYLNEQCIHCSFSLLLAYEYKCGHSKCVHAKTAMLMQCTLKELNVTNRADNISFLTVCILLVWLQCYENK